jgi:hypothetical protein
MCVIEVPALGTLREVGLLGEMLHIITVISVNLHFGFLIPMNVFEWYCRYFLNESRECCLSATKQSLSV